MKKINKKSIAIALIIFSILIIIYIPWLKGHNAGDNYIIANDGYIEYAKQNFIPSGRICTAIFASIMGFFKVNIKVSTSISLFLSIVIQTITIMYIKNIIEKYKKAKNDTPRNVLVEIIETLISMCIVCNFFMVDCVCFFESFIISSSFLLAIIAANKLVTKNGTESDIKNYIKSLILCMIASTCYQSSVTVFISFIMLFAILENKKISQIINDIFKAVSIILLSLALNMLCIKFSANILKISSTIGEKRLSFDIIKNIKLIIYNVLTLLTNTCNLFPRYLLIAFIAEVILLNASYVVKNKKDINILVKLLIITIWFIACSMSISLITKSSFLTGRLRIAIGMLVGVMLMYTYIQTEMLDLKNETLLSTLFIITIMAYLITNIISIETFIMDQNEVELLDKENAKVIEKYIASYEKENNITVKYVSEIPIIGRKKEAYYFEKQLNASALKTQTTAGCAINYYCKKNLEYKAIEYKDKNTIEEYMKIEQYKAIDDTLYIAVYHW